MDEEDRNVRRRRQDSDLDDEDRCSRRRNREPPPEASERADDDASQARKDSSQEADFHGTSTFDASIIYSFDLFVQDSLILHQATQSQKSSSFF